MNLEKFQYGSSKGLSLVLEKHGTHDQKTHGNWATGGTIYTSIIDRLGGKDVTGFSLDISSKNAPTSGYMASIAGAEETVNYDDFFSSRDKGREYLLNYMTKYANQLSERGAYFGIWVVKDQGTVYLDVSRRFDTRGEGIRAGFENEQQSIYDIENDAYIYMKDEVDERTNKAVADGSSNSSQSDDGRAEASLRGGNTQRDREKPLSPPHVCLGRYTVQKHRQGEHDQATHGNWAGDRYPADSVKGARDGAKEYAFKKGLKPDETIDYTKVVANRERASRIADIYEKLPKKDVEAIDEYEALASEVEEQFDYMTNVLGVKVEFVANDPYKTSKEMFDDVSRGVLKVLQTETTGAHPLFSDAQNNKFRAVHDYFGHAATGRGFGQDGEEAAWVHHSQMFTEKARGALTTETRGQNSFFNNRGKQFADQKVALLPEEFWAVPATFQKIKIIRFQAGLKPIFKHDAGGHDQATHGNWARGVTAEEDKLINQMEGVGPTLDELEAALTQQIPDMSDLVTYVNNDSVLYERATQGIDERVAERIKEMYATNLEMEELTEQQKSNIYDDVQEEMITEYIESDITSMEEMWQSEQSASFNPEDLHGPMDEVFAVEHQVFNSDGDLVTTLDSSTTNIYLDGERLVVQGQVATSDGDYAGEFQRSFFKSQDREGNEIWAVEHDLFKMDDEYAGVGFGSKFIAQQEAWYVGVGIGRIDVGTAWDGARHWAKSGYDFDERGMRQNVSELLRGRVYNSADFEEGSPNRIEFDNLMSKMVTEYDSASRSFGTIKTIDSDDFPIPNDFLMIGYADRFETGTNPYTGKPVYSWAGARLLDSRNMKYQKGLSKEGRSIIQGPIDRDGDGLVYDGTPREKPAPTVN